MPIFSVKQLKRCYRVPKREKGFWKTVRSVVAGRYETKVALDGISLEMEAGELVGYIGPNGAGKSTTVKILAGILVPDSGDVSVFGKIPWKHRIEIVRQIGVVFGQRTQLWWDLQVIESFELLKAIYKIHEVQYRQTVDELIAALDIADMLHTPVRMLSLGQRMRCDLAASLLHSPKLLFLDEPTIGLDAASKLAVRDFIRKLNGEKKVAVLLTTHDMDDIEALCRRVVILNEGKIDFDGTMKELRAAISPERYLVIDLVDERAEIIRPGAHMIRRDKHRVWLKFNPITLPAAQLITEVTAQHAVADLFVENPPIEETIARLYGKKT